MNNNNNQKLIIDTDCGYDDLIAILMLVKFGFEIKAVITTYGVCSSLKGAENLISVFLFCGLSIPVYKGLDINKAQIKVNFPPKDRQRAEKLTILKEIKKKSGFFIPSISTIKEKDFKEDVSIAALGPLTDIEYLYRKFPKIRKTKIYIYGGGIKRGNVLPDNLSEYNIALNPSAAACVFKQANNLIMCGVDSSDNLPLTLEIKQSIEPFKPNGRISGIIKKIILKSAGDFDYFYDPITASVIFSSEVVKSYIKGKVSVNSAGITKFVSFRKGNIKVITDVRKNVFYKQLKKLITGKT